jgi:hypothetical protein
MMRVSSSIHRRAALYGMLAVVFFACNVHAQWNIEEFSPSAGSIKPGLVVVDGRPAMVYTFFQSDPSFAFLPSYTRASDVEGSSWSTPVVLDTVGIGDYEPSLALIGGTPMLAYIVDDGDTNPAYLVTPKDALGAEWNDPVEIPNTGGIQELSFTEVNGKPAIAFTSAGKVLFTIATTVNGSSWDAPVTIESGIQPGFISLAVVEGKPAVCYQQRTAANKNKLDFVIAANADGSSWNAPVNIVQPTGSRRLERKGFIPSLVVVDGRPAVAYYDVDPSRDLMFAIAKTANGSSWNDPITVDSVGDAGNTLSFAVVNGYPAIAYRGAGSLKFVIATNVTGSSWAEPTTIGSEIDVGREPTLAVVGGEPAISYYGLNATAGGFIYPIRYARFECAAGTLDCNRDYNTCATTSSCVCDPECDSATAECVDGACQCLANNLKDCDADGSSCEVNTLTDDQNCGECGKQCDTATTECVEGICECLSNNLKDCDADGTSCEVNTLTDDQNCGECGKQCDSATTVGCVDGSCECATGRSKETAEAVACVLVDGSPPCSAGSGADLENNLCVDCAELLAHSPGGTADCQACASECQQCDASSGECVGTATRAWCMLRAEGSVEVCEACVVQFAAMDALLSACSDQVRVSVDCGLNSPSPEGKLHTAFTLYVECDGVRDLMNDLTTGLLNARRSVTQFIADPQLLWWNGSQWVPACTGCSVECTQGYTCHQGEHAITGTLQTSPPSGNTPGMPPRPIPTTPSPSPNGPGDTPRPADSASRLFLHVQCYLGALLLFGLLICP